MSRIGGPRPCRRYAVSSSLRPKFDSVGPGFHLVPLFWRIPAVVLGVGAFITLGVIILWP